MANYPIQAIVVSHGISGELRPAKTDVADSGNLPLMTGPIVYNSSRLLTKLKLHYRSNRGEICIDNSPFLPAIS